MKEYPSNISHFKLGLWTSFLGAPILWLIQFQTSYSLVPWTCKHGHTYLLHITSFVFLALAIGLVFMGSRHLRECSESKWPDAPEGLMLSGHFMALVGLMNSCLFALLIAAQSIPSFLISPCIQ